MRFFSNLGTLVLDDNQITAHTKFPKLPKLYYLWVNKNKIDNLSIFIDKLVFACPELRHLSLLGNDACPNYMNGGTPKQYRDYRLYVISRLKKIDYIDASAVTHEERTASQSLYGSLPLNTTDNLKTQNEIDEEKLKKILDLENQRSKKIEQFVLSEKDARRKKRRNKIKQVGDSDRLSDVQIKEPRTHDDDVNEESIDSGSTIANIEEPLIESRNLELDNEDNETDEVTTKSTEPPPNNFHNDLMAHILKRGQMTNPKDEEESEDSLECKVQAY